MSSPEDILDIQVISITIDADDGLTVDFEGLNPFEAVWWVRESLYLLEEQLRGGNDETPDA